MIEIRFRCKDGKCYCVEDTEYKSIKHFLRSIKLKKWIDVKELGLVPFRGKVNKKDITFIWGYISKKEE